MYLYASGLPHFTIVLYDFGTGPTMLYIVFVFLFFFLSKLQRYIYVAARNMLSTSLFC